MYSNYRNKADGRAGGEASSRLLDRKGPVVLVAEDDNDTRDMLRMMFEIRGCRVVEACNGWEAVGVAERERPALILMDGSLPHIDGLAATRLIRQDEVLGSVPIVALNGWGTASFHSAALAAGCNDCLSKPIDFERLESHIVRLFAASSIHGLNLD